MTETGIGKLWLDGTVVLQSVRYSIQTGQRGITQTVSGHLQVELGGPFSKLKIGPNSDLVLELADGRRWACTWVNDRGDLLNRGPHGIEPAKVG